MAASPIQSGTMNWNQSISSLPGPHLLQTAQWGDLKSRFGWTPFRLSWTKNATKMDEPYSLHIFDEIQINSPRSEIINLVAAVQVLIRAVSIKGLPPQVKVAYAPKGPLMDWSDPTLRQYVLQGLSKFSKEQDAILLKIDPDVRLGSGIPGTPTSLEYQMGHDIRSELSAGGWVFSDSQVQYKNTVLVDISPSEEDLLAGFKQKTRYNIRLAGRKGVTVRVGTQDDLDLLFQMYAETSLRDGFGIRSREYYQDVWGTFLTSGGAENPRKGLSAVEFFDPWAQPLIAEVDGEAIAGLISFYFGQKAWYLYGMSTTKHRNLMPNYLLQWEAIRHAKAAGCTQYDLWGAPDAFLESDPMWGVYRFKEGFQGEVVRTIGAWDLPLRDNQYKLYTQLLPKVLDLMRRRGLSDTRASVDTL